MSVNSIRNLLEYANQTDPNKIALIQNNISITFRELYEKVNQVANYFSSLKLPKGSRIGIHSNKSVEQVIAILAILSTDYVIVPITRFLKPEQVEHIIKDCDISCIITDKLKYKNISSINFNGKIVTYESISKDGVSFDELYKYYDKNYSCNIKGHDNAVITYSFGATGFPKGIVITHRNLIDGARVVSNYLHLKDNDVISGLLSFNLDYGLNQIFCALYKKITLAIHKLLLPSDFFNHLIRDKVTILPLMPIHITQMFDEDSHRLPTPQQLQNIRIITSSGGKLTNEMRDNIDKYFQNGQFFSMHGLSEAFRSAYLDPSQIKIRPTSIGKAIPDVDLYVINKDGEDCKPREVGELIHRGACIYKGYWNSPQDTNIRFKSIKILEKVINLEGQLTDELVVASGDFVYRDEEDYIYFVGRDDNMIKTSGYRVSPTEIESVVYENIPNIISAAIFSVENEKIEEEIVLVYSAPHEISKNELIFELKKHLANYMIPSIIVYKKSIPLRYGEIDKDALKIEVLKGL
jgi:acyl-CoA synthetase (AMP-forming)/AMP-acid ligase II